MPLSSQPLSSQQTRAITSEGATRSMTRHRDAAHQLHDYVDKEPGGSRDRRGDKRETFLAMPLPAEPVQRNEERDHSQRRPYGEQMRVDHSGASIIRPIRPDYGSTRVSGVDQMNWRSVGRSTQGTRWGSTAEIATPRDRASVVELNSVSRRSRDPATSAVRRRLARSKHPQTANTAESQADMTLLEDYETPPRRRREDGIYMHDRDLQFAASSAHHRRGAHRGLLSPSRQASAGDLRKMEVVGETATPRVYNFRVRIHECSGAFADFEASHRSAPAVYFAIHTAEERGHSGISEQGDYNPIFNDEFFFSSTRPERDALVCTLVMTSSSAEVTKAAGPPREKKVAECVVALHYLAWRVERQVWVPLVRHAGTPQAYEQGEVLISIFSEDFGYDIIATEEEEAVCSMEIHDILCRYAPQELHRLDWMTATYVEKGPAALKQLQSSYQMRTLVPEKVRLSVLYIDGLTDENGCPARCSGVQVVVRCGRSEHRTETIPYRRRVAFNTDFRLLLNDPNADAISLTVVGDGRRLGEAVAGLTNVQAGKPKEVTLMLVRAAETGDATHGGLITICIETNSYSSPRQWTPMEESKLRHRVQAYLWCYLRDELHCLDTIVGAIDDPETFMREWARTFGPEPDVRDVSVNVREATNLVDADRLKMPALPLSGVGVPPRCYARISLGPTSVHTGLCVLRNGGVSFNDPFVLQLYEGVHDAVEVLIVAETGDGDSEVGRVCFDVSHLPRQRPVTRTLHLVANATKRMAYVRGEVTVELIAKDFGLTGAAAQAAAEQLCSLTSPYMQRLEAITQRSSPETLHRVPYMLDMVPREEMERTIKGEAQGCGGEVAVAPMTVKILGVKEFTEPGTFHVKVRLNAEVILRTADVKGAAEVSMHIDHHNETTIRLKEAARSVVTFQLARHRALRSSMVLGEVEVALAGLVCGEKNILWLPVFPLSSMAASNTSRTGRGSASCMAGTEEPKVKVVRDRMPPSNEAGVAPLPPWGTGGTFARSDKSGRLPIGLLGVELQSYAFPATTVTKYALDEGTGLKGVSAQEAVTHDVTSLVAKMKPTELPRVQPMIAQCTSLKNAHQELRAELSKTPIGVTIYVNIESVDLTSVAGLAQEAQGGIAVEVSYGSEQQTSRKRTEFAQDVIHRREFYPQLRLDIPMSECGHIHREAESFSRDAKNGRGVGALELRLMGLPASDLEGGATSPAFPGARPSNEGRISPSHAGSANRASGTAMQVHDLSGENGVEARSKSSAHTHQRGDTATRAANDGGRSSNFAAQASTSPGSTDAGASGNYIRHDSSDNENHYDGYLGGVNNIRSYGVPAGASSRRSASRAGQEFPSHSGDWAHRNGDSASRRLGGAYQAPSSPATPMAVPAMLPIRPYRSEVGGVRLSLRAFLTPPLYKPGDRIRVPIVARRLGAADDIEEEKQRCIIGHITLRITLPAFEVVPPSLRLRSRQAMARVDPKYFSDCERRIAAYLLQHDAPALRSFHYDLYERDAVSVSWPVPLRKRIHSLLERLGPETALSLQEPSLSSNVKGQEQACRCEESLRHERIKWSAASSSRAASARRSGGLSDPSRHSTQDRSASSRVNLRYTSSNRAADATPRGVSATNTGKSGSKLRSS